MPRLLDMDVAIFPIGCPEERHRESIEAMPLYQNLDIAREGRTVRLDDGDPATPVPSLRRGEKGNGAEASRRAAFSPRGSRCPKGG